MFYTTDSDVLESVADDEVREEWLVDVVNGRKAFSPRIKYGIQLREALDITPLEVHVWCGILKCHIIDVQEGPKGECPEFCTARERDLLTR